MYTQFAMSISNGCRAAEALIDRYGASVVKEVEQLSNRIFRARLNDGRVAEAILKRNGTLEIREWNEVG